MDWHCSDPLCAGRSASYGNVGQNTTDDQMDIWDIVRRIFPVISCDRGNGDSPDACTGEDNLDYVIVLGAQVHADKPSVVLKYRLDEAILYLNENPETVCIVSGGQGKNEPYSEAYGMAQYLMQNGIDKDRILLEDQSKTTEENLRFSRKFYRKMRKWGSSRMIFICSALCRSPKTGLSDVCGIAADSTKFYLPNNIFAGIFCRDQVLIRSVK